jgi:hypothetical protein
MIVQLAQSSKISESAARQQIMNMIGGLPLAVPAALKKSPNWWHSSLLAGHLDPRDGLRD